MKKAAAASEVAGDLVDRLRLARTEGILPALETAHAFAHVAKIAPKMGKDQIIIVNLSGRGDKDCQEVARLMGTD